MVIKADTALIEGHAYVKDYQGLVMALSAAHQMSQDVENRLADGMDKIRNGPDYREYEGVSKSTSLFEYGLWFEYDYYNKDQAWALREIGNYKQDPSGEFREV